MNADSERQFTPNEPQRTERFGWAPGGFISQDNSTPDKAGAAARHDGRVSPGGSEGQKTAAVAGFNAERAPINAKASRHTRNRWS